jgi:DNA polymerase-3 subunit epsilon
LYDPAASEGHILRDTGIQTRPDGTLVDRALELLNREPADSRTIAHDILGIKKAPRVVCERLATALLGSDPRIRQLPDGQWHVVATAGRSPGINECTFAVVDVETTGGRASGGDTITEIAIVLLHDGAIKVALDTLVNPERPIPRVVSRVTGITHDDVRDKPVFDDIADDVLSGIAGRVFVAHNMRFDWGFVSRMVRRTRDVVLHGPRLCTVTLARRVLPGIRYRNLDNLSHYFGIEIARRHRAGDDARATAQLLVHLLDLAMEQGASTLRDLEILSRRRTSRRRKRRARPGFLEEL